MKTCNVFLTFEPGDEILLCDHSKETLAVTLAVTFVWYHFVCQYFTKYNSGFFLNFDFWDSSELKD